jgi:hypothetical protein
MKKFSLFIVIALAIKFDCIGQCSTPVTLSLNITPESCLGCCDGNIQVLPTGGCPPYSYTVTPTTSPNNFCSGNYTVSVQDIGCCPVVTQTTSVGTPTGIYDNKNANKISVGPNPSNGYILFKGNSRETFRITNYLGEEIIVIELNEKNNYTYNLLLIESGIYFVYSGFEYYKLVVLE